MPHSLGKLIEGQFSLEVNISKKKPSELTKALGVVIRVHLLVSLSAATCTLSGEIDEQLKRRCDRSIHFLIEGSELKAKKL